MQSDDGDFGTLVPLAIFFLGVLVTAAAFLRLRKGVIYFRLYSIPRRDTMSKASKNRLAKHLESLENRAVLSASGPELTLPPASGAAALPPPEYDTSLNAYVQTSNGKNRVIIDGSDMRDVITVQSYSNSNLKLRLDQLNSDGTVWISRTVTLNVKNLDPLKSLEIYGKDKADQITNLTSLKASVWSGDGNDHVNAGSGGDTVYGGNGVDNFNGQAGKDYLRGGGGGDNLYGDAGEDLLYGEAGNDFVYGGSENDSIWGGLGDDTLHGDGGNDTIYGDNGSFGTTGGMDIVFGGLGDDLILGEGGHDVLHGDFGIGDVDGGNDMLYGGAGNDKLNGNGGNDKLYGEEGHDELHGQNGVDTLYGGAGNDRLDGGFNDPNFYCDSLFGGLGADVFVRHKSALGVDDADVFQDLSSAQGDSTDNIWHW